MKRHKILIIAFLALPAIPAGAQELNDTTTVVMDEGGKPAYRVQSIV